MYVLGIYVEIAFKPIIYKKRILLAPSLAIYVIFVTFVHTREFPCMVEDLNLIF